LEDLNVEESEVPFWRAVAYVQDSLRRYMVLFSPEYQHSKVSGLYCEDDDKTHFPVPEGSASEIFTMRQIYQHARCKADETDIRWRLEFEWLYTRPNSKRWISKGGSTPDVEFRPDSNTSLPAKTSSDRAATDNKVRRSSLLGQQISLDDVELMNARFRSASVHVDDKMIESKQSNAKWNWNESMWSSLVQNKSIFDSKFSFVNDYTGQNLFHL
jgi:hypothetical protein